MSEQWNRLLKVKVIMLIVLQQPKIANPDKGFSRD